MNFQNSFLLKIYSIVCINITCLFVIIYIKLLNNISNDYFLTLVTLSNFMNKFNNLVALFLNCQLRSQLTGFFAWQIEWQSRYALFDNFKTVLSTYHNCDRNYLIYVSDIKLKKRIDLITNIKILDSRISFDSKLFFSSQTKLSNTSTFLTNLSSPKRNIDCMSLIRVDHLLFELYARITIVDLSVAIHVERSQCLGVLDLDNGNLRCFCGFTKSSLLTLAAIPIAFAILLGVDNLNELHLAR